MSAADKPARGQKTISIPGSQPEDERVVDDPERFREFLGPPIESTPELFPPAIRRGDRRKDVSRSRKTGGRLRRIELRNRDCSLIRPCFLRPDRSGRAEDVPAPLCCASAPSRSGL
jgi:hypothetical protein